MIKIKNLSYRYEKELVLKNINLEIKEGKITAIIGHNGSGKTTLAKHLNGLLIANKGEVFVDGISSKNGIECKKKVGFVFQNFEDQLIFSTVEEDVCFGLLNLGMDDFASGQIAKKTLEKLGILGLAKSNVNSLSLGQKQLCAIAGVLAMEPKYIVFDEPATMLDEKNRKNVMNLIKSLGSREKITPIIVTNSVADIKIADEVIVLKNGSVIYFGNCSKLSNSILKKAGLYE